MTSAVSDQAGGFQKYSQGFSIGIKTATRDKLANHESTKMGESRDIPYAIFAASGELIRKSRRIGIIAIITVMKAGANLANLAQKKYHNLVVESLGR